MAYIKLEDLQKFPIRRDHYDKEHGSESFINGVESVLEYAEYLPQYHITPQAVTDKSSEEWKELYADAQRIFAKSLDKVRAEAVDALADMILQFGYRTTFRRKEAICDGGLSALENALSTLCDLGCPTNSNGTITVSKLLQFMEEVRDKMPN